MCHVHQRRILVHIFSDVPEVIGRFGPFNIIHPHPGDPARVDQDPGLCPSSTAELADVNTTYGLNGHDVDRELELPLQIELKLLVRSQGEQPGCQLGQ